MDSNNKVLSIKIDLQPENVRFFGIFKPEEVVQGERFKIKITFSNNTEETFIGGFTYPEIRYLGKIRSTREKFNVPEIPSQSSKTLEVSIDNADASGSTGLCLRVKHVVDQEMPPQGIVSEEGIWHLRSEDESANLSSDAFLSFCVSSREEIYQKYSVIVALWASVLAISISTIGILISLFGA